MSLDRATEGRRIALVHSAWRRAGGRCECTQTGHEHQGRCNAMLYWGMQNTSSEGGWYVDLKYGAMPNLSSIKILCADCKRKGSSVGF
jgi:hypothetical protein